MQGDSVTAILTSCGRFDLLRITIDSFLKFNTYNIEKFVIYEDSGKPIPHIFGMYPFIKWIGEDKRMGQIHALDELWKEVQTPYAITLEDDWEFTREGFIEDSMRILETDPTILQVWLIQPEPHNVSPVEWGATLDGSETRLPLKYGIFKRLPQLWSWHRFNPSLKRLSDYQRIAPFSKHTTWNPAKPWKCEADISQVYHRLGYTAAILNEPYMRHLGEGRHVGV